MNTTIRRYAAPLALALLFGIGSMTPTLAATKHQSSPRQQQMTNQLTPAPSAGQWTFSGPPYATPSPYSCWSDEGYGRWSDCDNLGG